MTRLSQRVEQMAPSMTVAIDTKAKELAAAGVDIISLGAGEPDFPTPTHICEAGIQAIRDGKTRYTSPDGIQELKAAVCRKFARENNLQYNTNQIVISSGAKHCVSNALLALVQDDDEVIIPSPCWVTYPELVRFCGGTPILVAAGPEQGYKVTASQIKAHISQRTKVLLLNSPCNPTGAVYSREELAQIAAVIVEHDLICITDEIYEHILYDCAHTSLAALSPEVYDRTVVINGVSKCYAMTGWRIGYLAAPVPIAKAIAKVQGQATHHPCNISQWASVAALDGPQDCVATMRQAFTERRDYIVKALQAIQGLALDAPQGAFYAFAQTASFYGKHTPQGHCIQSSLDLCSYLLEQEKLALIPGAAFGEDRCIRLSFAASPSTLEEAMRRLRQGLALLR